MGKDKYKRTFVDQASTILDYLKILLLIDLLTYVIPIFVFKEFDFGIILDAFSFTFVILASDCVFQDQQTAKSRVFISLVPIAWIIIYDVIDMLLNADVFILNYSFTYAGDYLKLAFFLEVFILVLQFKAFKALSKSLGETQYIDKNEEFYLKDLKDEDKK